MTTRTVQLIDQSRRTIAVAAVIDKGTHFGGKINLVQTPPEVRAVFDEFEEIVSGQMFSFLDEIDDKIVALGLRVVFDDGSSPDHYDLQVYPETGDMSFRLTERMKPISSSVNGTEFLAPSSPEQVASPDRST